MTSSGTYDFFQGRSTQVERSPAIAYSPQSQAGVNTKVVIGPLFMFKEFERLRSHSQQTFPQSTFKLSSSFSIRLLITSSSMPIAALHPRCLMSLSCS
jgi:hypothetical protein